jgi:hypothetical protein
MTPTEHQRRWRQRKREREGQALAAKPSPSSDRPEPAPSGQDQGRIDDLTRQLDRALRERDKAMQKPVMRAAQKGRCWICRNSRDEVEEMIDVQRNYGDVLLCNKCIEECSKFAAETLRQRKAAELGS